MKRQMIERHIEVFVEDITQRKFQPPHGMTEEQMRERLADMVDGAARVIPTGIEPDAAYEILQDALRRLVEGRRYSTWPSVVEIREAISASQRSATSAEGSGEDGQLSEQTLDLFASWIRRLGKPSPGRYWNAETAKLLVTEGRLTIEELRATQMAFSRDLRIMLFEDRDRRGVLSAGDRVSLEKLRRGRPSERFPGQAYQRPAQTREERLAERLAQLRSKWRAAPRDWSDADARELADLERWEADSLDGAA